MFSKKKEVKKERRPRNPADLAQFGIFEVPDSLDDLGGDHDDDFDLEAELAALNTGGQPRRPAPKKPPPKPDVDLDTMVKESMRDIGSDEELSGDDDDPDLLNELAEITGDAPHDLDASPDHTNDAVNETTKLLEERLSMYQIAEKRAKDANESSKARRFNRGLKTIEQLLSVSRSGNAIDPEEIPPVLPPSALGQGAPKTPAAEPKEVPLAPQPVIEPEPSPPSTSPEAVSPTEEKAEPPAAANVNEELLNALKNRQKEYKVAAVAWKKSGNQREALECIKVAKQFDMVINAVNQGESVDLSDMPPAPALPNSTAASGNPPREGREESSNQQSGDTEPPAAAPPAAVPTAETLEAALKERLEVYRRTKTLAETEGNSSKARRYGRICKQYEDAIKLQAKGKAIPIDELPTPPGYPELSTYLQPKAPAAAPARPAPSLPSEAAETPKPSRPAPAEPQKPSPSKEGTPVVPPRTNSDKKKKLTTRVDRQIAALQQRQKELKAAALKAKKDGDLELAKDYLRQAKGIDPLLQASESGLPVDMKSIPLSPAAKLLLEDQDADDVELDEDGLSIVSSMDCSEATGTDAQIYESLEAQLKKQIKWCLTTRDHCKAMGDVPSYNKWGRLALDYTKDLDMLRVRKRDNLPPPQHHYENKTHSIVQCCTDLTDADMEITIVRGINYTKESDTYVIFELPWPTDTPSTDRTYTIRDTKNPEYNATFPLTGIIDRKSRQCQRIFKRHALKCQVWAKGGFFRADSLVGTVNIKLQQLETHCVLHDSFPLMDGRKAAGGKLEVKIRLRNPILTKQIEQNTDKWLVIDH